ncbi:uncharacterized protein LW93_1537 [Fusarium fujikuroi]|nr:uncharacterized protein LW93_1537 [Fusarium fujikuroi]
MPDDLHSSGEPTEERVRSSMTVETTLDDGTTINLTVSPASTESSAVTTTTTFTDSSFFFHISTSLPNHTLPLPTAPTFSEVPSPINLSSDTRPKPDSEKLSARQLPRLSNMSKTLPEDVVAIDTGKKSFLFYVVPSSKGNQLVYLESPDDTGTGDYTRHVIRKAYDPIAKEEQDRYKEIYVSNENKQVAAITWLGPKGVEIRVYYVEPVNQNIRELCMTGDTTTWEIGSLSWNQKISSKFQVRPNSSISASVHVYDAGNFNYNLRVFAAEQNKMSDNDLPQIHVYKFKRDESKKPASWGFDAITNELTEF